MLHRMNWKENHLHGTRDNYYKSEAREHGAIKLLKKSSSFPLSSKIFQADLKHLGLRSVRHLFYYMLSRS